MNLQSEISRHKKSNDAEKNDKAGWKDRAYMFLWAHPWVTGGRAEVQRRDLSSIFREVRGIWQDPSTSSRDGRSHRSPGQGSGEEGGRRSRQCGSVVRISKLRAIFSCPYSGKLLEPLCKLLIGRKSWPNPFWRSRSSRNCSRTARTIDS